MKCTTARAEPNEKPEYVLVVYVVIVPADGKLKWRLCTLHVYGHGHVVILTTSK
jgi:hypothetical protein